MGWPFTALALSLASRYVTVLGVSLLTFQPVTLPAVTVDKEACSAWRSAVPSPTPTPSVFSGAVALRSPTCDFVVTWGLLRKESTQVPQKRQIHTLGLGPGPVLGALLVGSFGLRTSPLPRVSGDGFTLDVVEYSSCCHIRFLVTHGTHPLRC